MLEKFHQIQRHAESVLNENKEMTHVIVDWKDDIRDMLLRVREQMIKFVDVFTNKFITQISKIEHDRRELASFVGADKHQHENLLEIESRLQKVKSIVTNIEQTQPNLRTQLCNLHKDEMFKYEQEIQQRDSLMKKFHE